eukprot:TRINITY_DN2734_c0_g2_i1.p1 TRINITY_DN2734_c0_g2~~TRINITY_DN2734_c0_g2_i1.p1  ORF type:complete len:143 (+),score=33.82 TRINITY_DN2734_c0_g2_i1:208-636(+)
MNIATWNHIYRVDSTEADFDSSTFELRCSSLIVLRNMTLGNSSLVIDGSSSINIGGCLIVDDQTEIVVDLDDIDLDQQDGEIVLVEYDCVEGDVDVSLKHDLDMCTSLEQGPTAISLVYDDCGSSVASSLLIGTWIMMWFVC